jgi:hypothetical protein
MEGGKLKTKTLSDVKIEGAEGYVEAVFSTFNVVDLDKDVTLPGAFDHGAPVKISAYNHASTRGHALPVGRGSIEVEGESAVLKGQFFMNTTHGRETFETVKSLGELGEWSYGYDIVEAEKGKFGEPEQDVQFLKKLKVNEVSPVIMGAGIGTGTLVAKGFQVADAELLREYLRTDPEDAAKILIEGSTTFEDHLRWVTTLLKTVNDRDADERRTDLAMSDEDRAAVNALEVEFGKLRDRFVQPSVKTELRKAQRTLARASMLLSSDYQDEEDE